MSDCKYREVQHYTIFYFILFYFLRKETCHNSIKRKILSPFKIPHEKDNFRSTFISTTECFYSNTLERYVKYIILFQRQPLKSRERKNLCQ